MDHEINYRSQLGTGLEISSTWSDQLAWFLYSGTGCCITGCCICRWVIKSLNFLPSSLPATLILFLLFNMPKGSRRPPPSSLRLTTGPTPPRRCSLWFPFALFNKTQCSKTHVAVAASSGIPTTLRCCSRSGSPSYCQRIFSNTLVQSKSNARTLGSFRLNHGPH